MDIQTQGEIGGGVLLAIVGFFARGIHKRFERVERGYVTTHVVNELVAASEARFVALLRESEQRVDARHVSNENNFREMRLQLEYANAKLFELALQKKP